MCYSSVLKVQCMCILECTGITMTSAASRIVALINYTDQRCFDFLIIYIPYLLKS